MLLVSVLCTVLSSDLKKKFFFDLLKCLTFLFYLLKLIESRKSHDQVVQYTQSNELNHIYHISPITLGDQVGKGGGVLLSHFSEALYRTVLDQMEIFGWEVALSVGVIFFRWDLKTPYIKI